MAPLEGQRLGQLRRDLHVELIPRLGRHRQPADDRLAGSPRWAEQGALLEARPRDGSLAAPIHPIRAQVERKPSRERGQQEDAHRPLAEVFQERLHSMALRAGDWTRAKAALTTIPHASAMAISHTTSERVLG